jgi:hypothetical protein
MNKLGAPLLALLLLAPLIAPAHASQDGFEAGYGPSLLSRLGERTPLFEPGDELWVGNPGPFAVHVALVRVYANLSLSSKPLAEAALPPSSIALLYRFGVMDVGSWYLRFTNATQAIDESYALGVLAPPPAPHLSVAGLGLNGTSLVVRLNATGALLYDMALALCRGPPGPLRIVLPPSLGNASIELYPENGTALLMGTPSAPFTFWAELYHPYSYEESGRLLTTLGLVLKVGPSYLQGGGALRLPSYHEASPREGRYVLRAFFQAHGSTLMQEAMVARVRPGSWLSGPSCDFEPVFGALGFSVDLRTPLAAWPRHIYLLYRASGEGLTSLDFTLPVAKALFASSPWGAPLRAPYLMKASGPGLSGYYYDEGVLYVLAASFPLRLELQLYLASAQAAERGLPVWNGQLIFSSPGDVYLVNITLARLDVSSELGAEALVTVARGASSFSSRVAPGGTLTLYLPEGDYNVSAVAEGLAISRSVSLAWGQASTVTLSPPQRGPAPEELAAWAALIAGLLLNFAVWRRAIRALRLARALSFKGAPHGFMPWPRWL